MEASKASQEGSKAKEASEATPQQELVGPIRIEEPPRTEDPADTEEGSKDSTKEPHWIGDLIEELMDSREEEKALEATQASELEAARSTELEESTMERLVEMMIQKARLYSLKALKVSTEQRIGYQPALGERLGASKAPEATSMAT